jgi:hypothetical protein
MLPVYNIEIYARECIFEVTTNGLPIFRKNAPMGCSMTYPLNTELVKKDNIVKVTLWPAILENGQPSRLEDITITGTIKCYQADDITGPESGKLLARIDFRDVIALGKARALSLTDPSKLFPLSKEFKFDNEEHSFRNRLLDAPIITDEKMLLTYGEKLRDILARHDIEALYNEYKPKLDDYVTAYPQEFPDPKQWFINLFKDDFFPGGAITEFKREDIGLRSWCEGRVWEIFVKPDQWFFKNKGLDGDINRIQVFVGMVDGGLKIVR